jgi:hypothetical protein
MKKKKMIIMKMGKGYKIDLKKSFFIVKNKISISQDISFVFIKRERERERERDGGREGGKGRCCIGLAGLERITRRALKTLRCFQLDSQNVKPYASLCSLR